MSELKIHFLGAAETVTGSKFYIETPEKNILIDCGVFQGLKKLREYNRRELPIDVSNIDLVLLTHGHLDHTGYLPKLVKDGYKGKIYGTAPTLKVTEIILLDSAKIQEEEADRANKEGYSKHSPALPFYDTGDVKKTLLRFEAVKKDEWHQISANIKYRFLYNGHIIGSVYIELEMFGKIFVFSGDLGRKDDPLLMNPLKPRWADYIFMESTYGNKLHPQIDVAERLASLINKTVENGGTVIIPSFAVERLQVLMVLLWQLVQKNKIPEIPIYIDSPMGSNVLSVFESYPDWHKVHMSDYYAAKHQMNIVSSYKETWEVIDNLKPKIIIAGSGMVTGGRVLTYLQQMIDVSHHAVILVGYQAEGTRGRQLIDGAHEIKLFGKYYEVKASIHLMENLSAHADQQELVDWLGEIKNIPENVFLIHGEASAADALRVKIKDQYGWRVTIPELFSVSTIVI